LIIKRSPNPQQLIDALIVVMGPDVTTGVTTAIRFSVSACVFLVLFESSGVYFPSHPTPSAVIRTPEFTGFFRFLIP
jgi:hypothetical protein